MPHTPSAYDGDPRVRRDGNGFALPSPEGWTVTPHRDGAGSYWTAQSEDGQVALDSGHYPAPTRFTTADHAIAHLIGEPQR